uniref:Uncharacterized protein n=1 Tax=viral metagenome TaxID=1070528 RepID=A0A6C0CAU7_9ZZZZ
MDIITSLAQINNDLYQDLFISLPISDKRAFISTCKITNQSSVQMLKYELSFQKMINVTKYFSKRYYSGFYNPLYKFTMELLFDGYEIPDKYIIVENRVLHQFPKIYRRLGERADLDQIKKLLKLNRNSFMEDNAEWTMAGAAKAGNVSILRWMIRNGYPLCDLAATYAVKGNQLRTLKWLVRRGCKLNDMIVSNAAKNGFMDIVKFLVFDLNRSLGDAAYFAALRGHFQIVKFIYSVDPTALFEVCEGAARSGNLDILKFAYQFGYSMMHDFYCTDVNILKWLLDDGHISPDINISKKIAWSGNLECLQFLYRNKFPVLDKDVFARAVRGQNVEMIKWLHSLRCPFDKSATKAAAGMSNPEMIKIRFSVAILKLLVEWGCELDNEVCSLAAYHGDLEMLQYLYGCGCKLDETVLQRASTNGHLHIIIWARRQGCHWNSLVCYYTVCWHHLDVLKWLRGVDRQKYDEYSEETEICPWDEQVCIYAIRYCHIDILKFAIENGCEYGEASYQAALETENSEIINYISEHYVMNDV